MPPEEPTTLRDVVFYAAADYDELGVDLATDQALQRISKLADTDALARVIADALDYGHVEEMTWHDTTLYAAEQVHAHLGIPTVRADQ